MDMSRKIITFASNHFEMGHQHRQTLLMRFTLLLVILTALMACERRVSPSAIATMDQAAALMEEYPDSSYQLLAALDTNLLISTKAKARYSLLMSKAMDKTYREVTHFNVLQPAIDYYFKHGSPDEKLQTYFYQAAIHLNAQEEGPAQILLLKANDLEGVTDSLTLARIIMTQGMLYSEKYDYDNHDRCLLRAAGIFKRMERHADEATCLSWVLDKSVINDNKERADSVIGMIKPLLKQHPEVRDKVENTLMTYSIEYEDTASVRKKLKAFIPLASSSVMRQLIVARAHIALQEPQEALSQINAIDIDKDNRLYLHYLANKADILERLGRSEEALRTYKEFMREVNGVPYSLLSNHLVTADPEYRYEKEKLEALRARARIVILVLSIAVGVLAIALVVVLVLMRQKKRLQQKNDAITRKYEAMNEEFNGVVRKYETISRQYETVNQEFKDVNRKYGNVKREYDAMTRRFEDISKEYEEADTKARENAVGREDLQRLLSEQKHLTDEVRQITRERMRLLNSILTNEIVSRIDPKMTEGSDPMDEVHSLVHGDIQQFMDSTRRVFKALYPEYLEPLEKKELTEMEINVACLYALGLTGKQIKAYTDHKRHYHLASQMRSKLGLDAGEYSLGHYFVTLFRSHYGDL